MIFPSAHQQQLPTPPVLEMAAVPTECDTGGSLGWKTRGALMSDFEDVAFELEASTTAKPKWAECKTSEGYHIIMVEGRR